ncbi:hypothetical protein BH10PSE6_BH10PSE6_38610 [soil metagenome]
MQLQTEAHSRLTFRLYRVAGVADAWFWIRPRQRRCRRPAGPTRPERRRAKAAPLLTAIGERSRLSLALLTVNRDKWPATKYYCRLGGKNWTSLFSTDEMSAHSTHAFLTTVPRLLVSVGVSLFVTFAGVAPVLAGSRPCSEPESPRSEGVDTTSKVTVTNRRSTPLTVEWLQGSSTVLQSVTLAPGESTELQTYLTDAWISRDARRRCLSRFVPTEKPETWEITATLEDDYERKYIRSFPVYVAPEFNKQDPSLLQQCLQVLESNARRIQEVLPSAAWKGISGIPIWLEYKRDWAYGGAYFASQKWLIANGLSGAKAKSIQFHSSLAVMAGSMQNPLMHEVAHAYHDLVLSYSYWPILAAYRSAELSGSYNAVRHSSGRIERAYAMSNHREFFATLSEAYFGTGDFFPFTREDLKEFDPVSYRLISNAWERPFEEASGRSAGRENWLRKIPR